MHRKSVWVGLLAASLMVACAAEPSGDADGSSAAESASEDSSAATAEPQSPSPTRPIAWSMSVQSEGFKATAEGDFATCCTVLTGYISDRTSEKDADEAIFTFPGGALGKLDAIAAGSYELKLGNFLFPGVAQCSSLMKPMTVEITKGSPNAEGTFSGQVRCVDPDDPSVELDPAAMLSGNFTLRK